MFTKSAAMLSLLHSLSASPRYRSYFNFLTIASHHRNLFIALGGARWAVQECRMQQAEREQSIYRILFSADPSNPQVPICSNPSLMHRRRFPQLHAHSFCRPLLTLCQSQSTCPGHASKLFQAKRTNDRVGYCVLQVCTMQLLCFSTLKSQIIPLS